MSNDPSQFARKFSEYFKDLNQKVNSPIPHTINFPRTLDQIDPQSYQKELQRHLEVVFKPSDNFK